MKRFYWAVFAASGLSLCGLSCHDQVSQNLRMASLLSDIQKSESVFENPFFPEGGVAFYDSVQHDPGTTPQHQALAALFKGKCLLQLGKESQAIPMLDSLLVGQPNPHLRTEIRKTLAIANLRLGERANCILNHSAESCIFPIAGKGVHGKPEGSLRAIQLYQELLKEDSSDLESRWLLNIAYMTIAGYPKEVPHDLLLPGLDADTSWKMQPFEEMAVSTGLDINNMAGGAIIDDFDNDGNLDLVSSGWGLSENMHYCHNNGNGTFSNLSTKSGLTALTGGLNIQQTDYNNDGLKDIFVLRGAWKNKYGKEPVSLLRNNGDGSFTDVTVESGLLSLHPTQTATWADFDNDGWLDVFIGAESTGRDIFPCQLYINNHNGTFTEIAERAGCNVTDFVKGVIAGDFNNDGRPDIFVSSLSGEKRLFYNEGVRDGIPHFLDVAQQAGIKQNHEPTFGTWFFDYDNDGWSDLVINNYGFSASLAVYAAADALHRPYGNAGHIILFHNNHDGSFTDVSEQMGLTKPVFSMGCNFGDIDNDGYPDMYFGTGNPLYQSLVPNKMFKNIDGKKFADVTTTCRVGNLQKGHGVSFADIDNDGDLDIYIDMGGAYPGDAYQNLLFVNPGQTLNHWLGVDLEGTHSNRAAIGARMKCCFKDQGAPRTVFLDCNSGGSFGSNPLRQHFGLGNATLIDSLVVRWPGSGTVQTFANIRVDQIIHVKETDPQYTKSLKLPFRLTTKPLPGCAPNSPSYLSPAAPVSSARWRSRRSTDAHS